jgi:hypothetical protein
VNSGVAGSWCCLPSVKIGPPGSVRLLGAHVGDPGEGSSTWESLWLRIERKSHRSSVVLRSLTRSRGSPQRAAFSGARGNERDGRPLQTSPRGHGERWPQGCAPTRPCAVDGLGGLSGRRPTSWREALARYPMPLHALPVLRKQRDVPLFESGPGSTRILRVLRLALSMRLPRNWGHAVTSCAR